MAEAGGTLELDGRRDSLPCRPSQSVVAHQLHELSTPELAAELYRRLCVGRLGEPGPFKGTMLDLYLERPLRGAKSRRKARADRGQTGGCATSPPRKNALQFV